MLDWRTGVSYGVAVQTPQYRMDSLDALLRTPVSAPFSAVNSTTATSIAGSANPTNAGVGAGPNQSSAAYGNPGAASGGPQLLSNLVTVGRSIAPTIVNHYNVQPVFDVYANVDRRDLGSVGAGVEKIVAEMTPKLPRGTTHRRARPVPDHAEFLLPPRPWHDLRRRAGLPADGGEFPIAGWIRSSS